MMTKFEARRDEPKIFSGVFVSSPPRWGVRRAAGANGKPQNEETGLAKATQNPVGDIVSVPFQFNFNGGRGLQGSDLLQSELSAGDSDSFES